MTNPELFELLDRFERSSLQELKLSEPGFSLELRRAGGTPAAVQAPAPPAVPSPPCRTSPLLSPPDSGLLKDRQSAYWRL